MRTKMILRLNSDKWIGSRQRFSCLFLSVSLQTGPCAKALNGPPIPTPDEEDEVSVVRPPHGLQVLEQELFQKKSTKDFAKLMGELKKVDIVLQQFSALMKNATLNEEEFWQSIQEELIVIFIGHHTNGNAYIPDSIFRGLFLLYQFAWNYCRMLSGSFRWRNEFPWIRYVLLQQIVQLLWSRWIWLNSLIFLTLQTGIFCIARSDFKIYVFFVCPHIPMKAGPVNYLSKLYLIPMRFKSVFF